MKVYQVKQGWITYRQCGSSIDERFNDNPSVWDCNTLEEAFEIYNDIDLAADYKTERMCAGRAWSEQDAYKSIEVCVMMSGCEEVNDIDECEWLDYDCTVKLEKYGCEQYENEN